VIHWEEDLSPLRAARGIVRGISLSTAIWILIAAMAWQLAG
jgi:hypothetical protein